MCICRASQSYIQNDTEMVLLKYSYNHIYYDRTHCIFIKIIQSLSQKETGCLTNSVSVEYRKIDFQIYIYIRLEVCLSTFVYPCGPVVRVVDLRI